MGNTYSLKRLDVLEAKKQRLKYIQTYFPQLEDMAKQDLWFSCMYSMQLALQSLSTLDLEIAQKKIKSVNKELGKVRFAKEFPVKQRGWLLLSKLSFEKACRLRNFLKVGL